MASIPEQYRYLTDAPLFAHLATVRPDGSVQSNPMWFLVSGDEVRFTHTRTRQKYRNLQANPTMSLSIVDPVTLESAIEFLRDDECVEVTPESVRIRKVELDAGARAKEARRIKNLTR